MNDQQQDTARAASYLATQQRMDLRGFKATRTGKTRSGKLKCIPPNVQCGGRCIPSNWDCRLKGQGTNSDLAAHKTDPLAGIASLQRGAKDVVQGITRVNPAQVQRGRNSLIRGAVKLTPGDNLERKKRLKKQLNDVSRPLGAVIGLTLVGLSAHAGLKRGFPGYRNGLGADVDRAAGRAVDSVLDVLPGIAGNRAARRAAGAGAAGDIASVVTRGQSLERTRAATSGNLGRIGPLSFRPNAANTEASGLVDAFNRLQGDARSGNRNYDSWRQTAVQTLYGATSPGNRPNGQRGSIFSEHAANEFLVSKFRLENPGVVGSRGSYSMAARNTLLDTQLSQRLGQWGQALRNDMQTRRFVNSRGVIDNDQINRYIREVAGNTVNTSFVGMNRAQRSQATAEAQRLMASAIRGDRLINEARSMRRNLVGEFDTYFNNVAQGMRRNAAASDSPFGDGLTGLARYVSRTTGQTTQILSRDHADLILRNHFHTRVMRLNNDFSIGENTARRVAQQISRSTTLPDADSAYRTLNSNGFTRLSRGAVTTGKAPTRLRTQTQLIQDILNRQGNEGMSRAAAQREARRLIAQRSRRGDAAEPADQAPLTEPASQSPPATAAPAPAA
jgi:hypothetical protein